jgi:DNA-directed RNA polymerase specialized sigma24 family protein
MKAPLLVEALRTRDPGAPAALYDTHGESLFRYCWFILRSRDAAQVALRDTLVLAEAHIRRLHDPEMLRPWLYALARAECLRRQESAGPAHDAVIARPDQPDADRRLIAWHAVMSLDPVEREALELTIRHGMPPELAARVMGVPAGKLQQILGRSRIHLEHALAGEILARHGVHGCPGRVAVLQGWAGELTVPLREALVKHATSCQVCHRYLPRNVAATKVYSLLPLPVPPQAMRLRVMTCFTDPELVGYRMFVAGKLTGFDQAGFPDESAAAMPPTAGRRSRVRVWTGPAAAVVAVAMLVASAIAISRFGGFDTAVLGVSSVPNSKALTATPTTSEVATGSSPAAGGQGAASAGASSPAAESVNTRGPGAPTRLFLRATTGPVPDRVPTPAPSPVRGGGGGTVPPAGQLQASPGDLDLGTGSTGAITLTASGGPVTWSASTASADLTLSSEGGAIPAGQQATVTVTVSRAQDPSGQTTITFSPGGETVSVSWSAPASTSPPPSPAPTVTPTEITPPPRPTPTHSMPTPGPPSTSAPPTTSPPAPASGPAQTPTATGTNPPVVVSPAMPR